MRDFFKLMWRRGWKFILIVVVIWLIYFLITFFYPDTFNFTKKKTAYSNNFQTTEAIPLRYKIYNFFFNNPALGGFSGRNNINNINNNASGTEIIPEENSNNTPYIWGVGTSTSYRDKNRLTPEDLYVFPNTKINAVAQNFRFDDVLLKEGGRNVLKDGTVITGEINTHYLASPFFSIDIYDADGNYIYLIPASGRIMEEDENLLAFSTVHNSGFNYSQYKGEGFLVIWTDNSEVESILISKIIIE